ncbi:MAG TPA: prephenate dehydrogenase dimerization domain-containing protein [Thermoanaerobaculia bacterium]|nr:prephenate dehydrogenase dimerization domain-containing protein [Thermoanaerobaculia bacterium]
MTSAPRALIAGLGLIGGSIGMALRARGWRAAFLDPNVDLRQAQNAGAADERVEAIAEADVVVLATPVDIAVKLLGGYRGTSVASVMLPFKDAKNFVAGHPLAGSHERGLGAARADLFNGCSWFLERHDPIVDRLVTDCGARIEIVSAEEHDAAVALTSHLPQLLSTALAAYLDGEGRAPSGERELTDFAGTGLQTFLRLAASDGGVWSPVLAANRQNLVPHFDRVMAIARRIVEGDRSPFDAAQHFARSLPRRSPK